MSGEVTELHIVDEDHNIFDTDVEYVIPLYQRAYAWEDRQLVQLIEDIQDVDEEASYYRNSLEGTKWLTDNRDLHPCFFC